MEPKRTSYMYRLMLAVNSADVKWIDEHLDASRIQIMETEFSPEVAGGIMSAVPDEVEFSQVVSGGIMSVVPDEVEFSQVVSGDETGPRFHAYLHPERDLPAPSSGDIHIEYIRFRPGTTVADIKAALENGVLKGLRDHCRAYRLLGLIDTGEA